MVKVLVPLADGSEEMEAVIAIDVLRRAGAEVIVASVMPGRLQIVASRRVLIAADKRIDECLSETWDMIVLPGGIPGAEHLQRSAPLAELLRDQHKNGRFIAAICAAPAIVLGPLGLLRTTTATCHPNFMKLLSEHAQQVSAEAVVTDGKLITSQGPGTAMEFSLQLVSHLFGESTVSELRTAMVLKD